MKQINMHIRLFVTIYSTLLQTEFSGNMHLNLNKLSSEVNMRGTLSFCRGVPPWPSFSSPIFVLLHGLRAWATIRKFKQNSYVAYYAHAPITFKIWHCSDQRGPILAQNNRPAHNAGTFTHKNLANQSICDTPCPIFDWTQDSINKGKYHSMSQYTVSA
jgi:hypothetical protein